MKTTFEPCHAIMARNTVGQASRLSHFSNHPLERKSVFQGTETGATPVLRRAARFGCFILLFAFCLRASGQTYSIDWHKISGGGGTSTNGTYSVSGTIGQPDAGLQPMSGGDYSLTGGFWSWISVVQTPGAPMLYISHSGNTVTIYWQNVSGWNLQQNNSLANSAGWSANSSATQINGTNYLNLASPSGNLFFRLSNQ